MAGLAPAAALRPVVASRRHPRQVRRRRLRR
jgi:hypothetical protein